MAEANHSTQIADCQNSEVHKPKKRKRDQREYNKKYQADNSARIRAAKQIYRQENAEKLRVENKKWRETNKEKTREYHKRNYEKNKTQIKAYCKARYEANKDTILQKAKVYHIANKEKINRQQRVYNAANKHREQKYRIKKLYGLNESEYKQLRFLQGGKCAVCGRDETCGSKIKRLHVDHCHKTGKVRGLLCSRCNVAIGGLKDDPVLLRKAADYLEAAKQ